MRDQDVSASALVVFDDPPFPSFARAVSVLAEVLDRRFGDEYRLTWDNDDLVFFDMGAARMALAWYQEFSGSGRGCLAVAVGRVPGGAGSDPLAGLREAICQGALRAVVNRPWLAEMFWHAGAAEITTDYLDEIAIRLETLLPQGPASGNRLRGAESPARPGPEPHPGFAGHPDALIERLVARAQDETQIAMPGRLPRPSTGLSVWRRRGMAAKGAHRRHSRPAHDHAAMSERSSVPVRAAVGAVTAALLLTAFPLGAALLTWNALGGADLRMTLRASVLVALLGIWQGGFPFALLA